MALGPTYDLFVSYADADRAWVEGVLLHALEQSGISWHTEQAFALGVPRISEFERAIKQSQRTLLILSPAYLTDNFNQFTDLLAQSYGLATATWPVIPLILKPVTLPSGLAMLTALDATDADRWPSVIDRLCTELQRPVPGPAPKPPCPYPGMVPFRAEDARFFYGREPEIQQMLQHLRHQRLLFVIGPSGSGKSSLVRAGLLPRLNQSQLFPPNYWLVQPVRLAAQPLAALGGVFHEQLEQLDQSIASLLEANSPTQRLLLVLDQFEELFTFAERDEQRQFIATLKRLRQVQSCTLLLAMRADFYPDLMSSDLWPIDASQRLEIAPLRGETLRQAIEQPAVTVGAWLEPGLVDRLLSDAADEPGVLPLIQETMALLWDRMQYRLLTLSDYMQLGRDEWSGLAIAIATKADATLADLEPVQQTIARRIFLRLIQFGEGRTDTRRQQQLDALRSAGDDPALFDQTMRYLVENRLLTLSGEVGGSGRTVDIAHEALITGWPRLQTWVHERRTAEQIRRRLENKEAEWLRLGRLLAEVELTEIERWLDSPDAEDLGYNEALLTLVRESREHYQQEKQRWKELYEEAERQRSIAVARHLATQALAYQVNRVDLALLLSAEACRNAPIFEARDCLLSVLLRVSAGVYLMPIVLHGHTDQVVTVAFSPDGKLLASSGGDRMIILWDVAARCPSGPSLTGHTSWVHAVAFSSDGRMLASGSHDDTIILWDVGARQQCRHLPGKEHGRVRCLAFSPDGTILASGHDSNEIRLWEVASGQPIGTPLIGHKNVEFRVGEVYSVAFSPDGTTLASGGQDGAIILWDVARRQPLGPPLTQHTLSVMSLSFSSDGTVLASCGGDEIFLWDIARQQPLSPAIKSDQRDVRSVALSPDGKRIVSGGADNDVRLWDVASRKQVGTTLFGHARAVQSVAFGPDGTTLASGGSDGAVVLWKPIAPEPLGYPLSGHTAPVSSVAFNSDGILASVGQDERMILWALDHRQSLGQSFTPNIGALRGLAFSPDSRIVAIAGRDGVLLLDVASRSPLGPALAGQTAAGRALAFSPDSRILATTSKDGSSIILWDVASGQPLGLPLSGATARVVSLAFSPDGTILVSGGLGSSTITAWDIVRGQPLDDPFTGLTDPAESVAFSPDGKILAAGGLDSTIMLWEVASRRPIGRPLIGHTHYVVSVSFSPDGTILASGSFDRTVRLWDVASGRSLGLPLTGHTDQVNWVAFNPVGSLLVSGSNDQSVRVWDLGIESWLSRACQIVDRNLTHDEWNEFLGAEIPYHKTFPNLPSEEACSNE